MIQFGIQFRTNLLKNLHYIKPLVILTLVLHHLKLYSLHRRRERCIYLKDKVNNSTNLAVQKGTK